MNPPPAENPIVRERLDESRHDMHEGGPSDPGEPGDPGEGESLTAALAQVSEIEDEHRLRQLRHELANELHGIVLQVRCAELALNEGRTDALRQNLAHMESAAYESRRLVDQIMRTAALRTP